VHLPIKSLLKPRIKRERGKARPPRDPRTDHPAIKTLKDLTGYYPHRAINDRVIERPGADFYVGRLRHAFEAWVGEGHNEVNINGILDWYEFPERHTKTLNGNDNGKRGPDMDVGSTERRAHVKPDPEPLPPAKTKPIEREFWNDVCGILRDRFSAQVFDTWFRQIVFDGFSSDRPKILLRTPHFTLDWISRYYDYEALDDAIAKTTGGKDNLQVVWVVEEEVFDEEMVE